MCGGWEFPPLESAGAVFVKAQRAVFAGLPGKIDQLELLLEAIDEVIADP